MNKKRRPLNRRSERPVPYCKPDWSAEQRITYYSKPDPLSGCHIWRGPLEPDGYGCLRYRGKAWRAHRLAWTVKYGPIPAGMILCHRCDVRRCVNPDHLILGTIRDNNADIKNTRLRLAYARAATAPSVPGSAPDLAPIRIFYHGVELMGEVAIRIVDPEFTKAEESSGIAFARDGIRTPARTSLRRRGWPRRRLP